MVSLKKHLIIALAAVCVISFASANSFAQKIGVIDQQKVLDVFPDYAAANTKLQGILKTWQDTVLMMQKNLKEKYDNYQKAAATMTADAKAKAEEELNKMNQDIQNYNNLKTNNQNGEYLKLQQEVMKPVSEKLSDAIASIAKKKNLELVLEKSNKISVPYVGDKVVDITPDVQAVLKK